MARLVGGTLDLSRQLLASPSRGCTAVPASSRPHPKFMVVAAHFEGARRLRRSFAGDWETLYGRLCPVPYGIISLQQPHEGQVLALLLSCLPIWLPDFPRFRHLHLSFIASNRPLFDSSRRAFAKWFRSDTPCIPPCSSTGCSDRIFAVLAPSRHMSLSDLRGIITGITAWSARGGHRQDIVLPVFQVCIIPSPLARTS